MNTKNKKEEIKEIELSSKLKSVISILEENISRETGLSIFEVRDKIIIISDNKIQIK